MKKMVFIAGALMLVVAGSAMAGSDLAWNDCAAGGGVFDRAVTCTNTGSGTMYLSFQVPASMPQVAAEDAFLDVQTQASTSSWWVSNPFTARWGSGAADGASGLCTGWWAGAPNGPIVFAPNLNAQLSASRIRVRVTGVIAAGEEQALDPGIDYGAGQILLKNSAGTFGNVECGQGGAIAVYDINLQQPGGVPDTHLGQTPVTRNCCTFRGAQSGQTCPGATPTQKATWGSIKALYR